MNIFLLAGSMVMQLSAIVILHEGFHYAVAKAFKVNPHFTFKNLTPSVSFENRHNDLQNLLIALAGPLPLVIIGFCMMGHTSSHTVFFMLFSLCNAVSLLPVSADGQVILLSIINMVKIAKDKCN